MNEFIPSTIIYADLVSADIDCEGNGHIIIKKHTVDMMETSIHKLRSRQGESCKIIITEYRGNKNSKV